jgi:hypothetical protein
MRTIFTRFTIRVRNPPFGTVVLPYHRVMVFDSRSDHPEQRRGVKAFAFGRLVLFAVALLAQSLSARGDDASVPYPEGYRTWVHVRSGLVTKQHPNFAASGGFRHIYANPQATAGYRDPAGKFPDGSVIVVDWLEGKDDNGSFTESTRRRLDVMMKDSVRFAATGGWGYEQFIGDSRTERNVPAAAVTKQCAACHSGPGTRDSVFSKLRE